jgi:hypothetical protein
MTLCDDCRELVPVRGAARTARRIPAAGQAVSRLAVAAALTALAALAGCATPEGDPQAYREEALSTLKAADSEVRTVRLTLQLRLAQRTFVRAADDAITTAETSLSSAAGTFTGLQPPRGADAVRDTADRLLSDAEDAVADGRIAVRRDDAAAMRQAYAEVSASASAIERAPKTLPGIS